MIARFAFCTSDHSFDSEQSPTSADACGEEVGKRLACVAPEVNLREHIMYASAKYE